MANLTVAAWALVEVGVRVRERVQGKGRADRDRGTRMLIAAALGAAILAALGARSLASELRMPAALRSAGVVVMWLGLTLRVSYTGLLLILAGFGAALGNWLSLAACVVLPLPAIVWRIHVEEAELDRVLGRAYRTYRSDRARLIPRLW